MHTQIVPGAIDKHSCVLYGHTSRYDPTPDVIADLVVEGATVGQTVLDIAVG